MTLLIDMGNTRIKSCLWDGGSFTHLRADPWQDQLLPDSVCDAWLSYGVTRIVACSVVSAHAEAQLEAIAAKNAITVTFVRSAPRWKSLQCAYRQYQNLGDDRWVAMIGGYEPDSEATCVIDLGTAVTVDLIDSEGLHRGGAIFPGVNTMRHALTQQTHALKAEDREAAAYADNTLSCIAGGTLFTVVGAIERYVHEARDLLDGASCRVIMTGGGAAQILPLLHEPVHHRQYLIFEGLVKAAELT